MDIDFRVFCDSLDKGLAMKQFVISVGCLLVSVEATPVRSGILWSQIIFFLEFKSQNFFSEQNQSQKIFFQN